MWTEVPCSGVDKYIDSLEKIYRKENSRKDDGEEKQQIASENCSEEGYKEKE